MKISCLPVSFYGEVDRGEMSIGDWFRMAKFTEYLDGADLGIGMIHKRTPAYLEALKAELHEIGIPLVIFRNVSGLYTSGSGAEKTGGRLCDIGYCIGI